MITAKWHVLSFNVGCQPCLLKYKIQCSTTDSYSQLKGKCNLFVPFKMINAIKCLSLLIKYDSELLESCYKLKKFEDQFEVQSNQTVKKNQMESCKCQQWNNMILQGSWLRSSVQRNSFICWGKFQGHECRILSWMCL